ncbi:MAG: DUF1653 domain-containing protein [Candidatus Pacebacteria bacterium]|nr:DUF1653 domain-containing protein [Candidatus Paceibacterota bacterium]MCF7863154.1 DUF1653 domain-containing protein [Candidatus Paceibacterota bacterium]
MLRRPQKGFYYHFKHDPTGLENNFAYEVMGTAIHTEDKEVCVVYRPLYKSSFFGKNNFLIRPLENFTEKMKVDGKFKKRFSLIKDKKILARLRRYK